MTTDHTRSRRTALRRMGLAAAAVVLGGTIIAPTAGAQAAPEAAVAAATSAPATAVAGARPATIGTPTGPGASESDRKGRMGVWANIYNRSGKAEFRVKNRTTGATWTLAPHGSHAFDTEFQTVCDEVELSIQIPGQREFEIDIANPTMGWPNVTVDGDNENFSQWETKYFAVGDSRVEIQRHNDQDDRKRFFITITPPGPIAEPASVS